jgi:hypothetical protein
MSDTSRGYPHFRLNFEQQQKRAKELLKAARAGEAAALQRLTAQTALRAGGGAPQLADAQRTIARELRCADWAHLKRHIGAMERERSAALSGAPLDADLRTLHVRCGSDIKGTLAAGGFLGDFYEHSYPYLAGPVREGEGCLEERARFLVASYDSPEQRLVYADVLDALRRAERELTGSADYERVVIWSEGDCYDQLVLVRLLGHYATQRCPPQLELVNLPEFPGATRFLGLGQLPPEALRLLWAERRSVAGAQLTAGLAAWRALANPDARELAALARGGTPALPLLAPALLRHLAELPAVGTGLSLTERMALELLVERPQSLGELFVRMTHGVDPLPGQGDYQMRDRVLGMEGARERVFVRAPGVDREGRVRSPWTDVLEITVLGRAVLRGEADFRALDPPARWVGGVRVEPGLPVWRWDETRRDVVRA